MSNTNIQSIVEKAKERGRVIAGSLAVGVALLAMIAFSLTVSAQQPQLVITDVLVNDPAVGQITINGMNFDNGNNLQVSIGEFPNLVIDPPATPNQIIAFLPPGIPPGAYLLLVTSGGGGHRMDSFNITIPGDPPPTTGVPAGAIILWDQSNQCPEDYTLVSNYDNLFIQAGSTAGVQGGAANHSHTAGNLTATAHTHSLDRWNQGSPIDDNSGGTDYNTITSQAGGGAVGGTTGNESNIPPFVQVLLCRRNG